ncbi:MAG: cytochrome c biogenesis CcdA family protein [Limnochordia bacterium]|jgi:cytochrome c-type biogenesis protein
MPEVSLYLAVAAGFLSLLSPCVLALVPAYVTYLTGVSVQGEGPPRRRVIINSLLFIAGFSLIFILLGASASILGGLLIRHQFALRRGAGILVIILGIHTMGLFKLPFLQRERRLLPSLPGGGGLNSLLIGMAFAAGWSPCVGPILATILLYASTASTLGQGVLLLAAYSFGLALPFFLIALFIGQMQRGIRKLLAYERFISMGSGLLLVIIGLMLYTNYFQRLALLFNFSLF